MCICVYICVYKTLRGFLKLSPSVWRLYKAFIGPCKASSVWGLTKCPLHEKFVKPLGPLQSPLFIWALQSPSVKGLHTHTYDISVYLLTLTCPQEMSGKHYFTCTWDSDVSTYAWYVFTAINKVTTNIGIHTFHIIAIYPCTIMPGTLHMWVLMHCYCSLHIDPEFLHTSEKLQQNTTFNLHMLMLYICKQQICPSNDKCRLND